LIKTDYCFVLFQIRRVRDWIERSKGAVTKRQSRSTRGGAASSVSEGVAQRMDIETLRTLHSEAIRIGVDVSEANEMAQVVAQAEEWLERVNRAIESIDGNNGVYVYVMRRRCMCACNQLLLFLRYVHTPPVYSELFLIGYRDIHIQMSKIITYIHLHIYLWRKQCACLYSWRILVYTYMHRYSQQICRLYTLHAHTCTREMFDKNQNAYLTKDAICLCQYICHSITIDPA
jgi:hypothetical protein